MKFGILGNNQRLAWNDAVETLPEATFYHLFEWRDVMTRCFPHFEPVYLYAADGAGFCGLLPLFHVQRRPFGSALISIPLGVYGGPIAQEADVRTRLMDLAAEEATRRGVGFV